VELIDAASSAHDERVSMPAMEPRKLAAIRYQLGYVHVTALTSGPPTLVGVIPMPRHWSFR
jgi:hypothetical protein